MGASSVRANGAQGKEGGWGRQQGAWSLLSAEFSRGCPSDIPLRVGAAFGERGNEEGRVGDWEDRWRRSEREALCLSGLSSY